MLNHALTSKIYKKHCFTALVMASVTASAIMPAFSATAADAVPINLPAQSLDRDIRDLARQAGITISFSRRALKKYNRAAFSGNYTPSESLSILLENTDYTHEFVN